MNILKNNYKNLEPEIIELEDCQKIIRSNKLAIIASKRWLDNKILKNFFDLTLEDFNQIISISSGEPYSKDLDEIMSTNDLTELEGLLVIGGGSSIDSAKMIAILHSNGGKCHDYELSKKEISSKLLPIISIPTTSGSGSESSIYTVINSNETNKKFTLTHTSLLPQKVLLLPELTFGLSNKNTISSGMDAFIQAFESFFSKKPHHIATNLAITVMYSVLTFLPIILKDSQNYEARKQIQIASFLSGICINYARTGLVHTTSVSLSNYTSLLHGELNVCILPYVITFNHDFYKPPKNELIILLHLFNLKNLDSFFEYVISFCKNLKIKLNINKEIRIEKIIQRMEQDVGLPLVNPSPITPEKLENFIQSVLNDN